MEFSEVNSMLKISLETILKTETIHNELASRSVPGARGDAQTP